MENLKRLLNSMSEKGWMIDTFFFIYKKRRYIVVVKKYLEHEKKPDVYALAKIEFIKEKNLDESIYSYANDFEVRFNSVYEFANFFNIEIGDAKRPLFIDFSNIFEPQIPTETKEEKEDVLRCIQASRCEPNNPKAIYCYDIRRNGTTIHGNNKRSEENSNKARTLRPKLYDKFKDDLNLSFYFSINSDDEKTDEEIIYKIANRY